MNAAHALLPVRPFATPLFGRAGALADLRAAFAGARLVAIVGPPGVGKTRLAQELAASWYQPMAVDLSEARDEAGFLLRMAQALGVAVPLDARAKTTAALIGAALAELEPERLLLLDNFEQLPPGADAFLARWSEAGSPHLLVTTRRRLAIPGCRTVPLSPLSLAVPGDAGGWSEAGALLASRARPFAGSTFDTAPEREAIEALAGALDGLPLALELAAARLRLLSPLQLLERLSERFRILRRPDGSGGRPDLRRSLADSFALLDPGQQQDLIALSAFRGNFTLDAAEAVLGEGGGWALDRLEALLDHSVLAVDDDPVEKRYRLLICVREYAEGLGRAPQVELRHAERTVAAAEALAHSEKAGSLVHERENLAAVVERAEAVGAALALRAAIALAAPACALPYAAVDGHLTAALASAGDEGPDVLVAQALLRRGTIRRFLGMLQEAESDLERAVALSRKAGDATLLAEALAGRGHNAAVHARWQVARGFLAEAAAADPDPCNEGRSLVLLANTHCNEDDHERAEALFRAALAAAIRDGDEAWVAMARLGLGILLLEVGALEEAGLHLDEALAMHRRSASSHWEGVTLGFLARWKQECADLPGALDLYPQALLLLERAGVRRAEGVARLHHAAALLESGAFQAAALQLDRALPLVRATCPDHEGLCLALQAGAALCLGSTFQANVLFAQAAVALEPYSRPIFRAVLGILQGGAAPAALAACSDVRLALRIAARLPAEGGAPALLVAADGRWFQPPGAPAPISLQRRKSLRGILAALVVQRQRHPREPLPLQALVDAGWPGERILAQAAAERVYAAVATLRRLGLRGLLQQKDEGYLLSADHPLVVA